MICVGSFQMVQVIQNYRRVHGIGRYEQKIDMVIGVFTAHTISSPLIWLSHLRELIHQVIIVIIFIITYPFHRDFDFIDTWTKFIIISNPRNIVVIEWAERVRKVLPENTIWIEFDVVSEKQRKITVIFKFLWKN